MLHTVPCACACMILTTHYHCGLGGGEGGHNEVHSAPITVLSVYPVHLFIHPVPCLLQSYMIIMSGQW